MSSEYPPFIVGGVGTYVENLVLGLNKVGVKVTVLSGYPGSRRGILRTTEANSQVDVIRFPYPDVPPRHTWLQLLNMKDLCRVIKTIDPDVIHGQQGSVYPASIKLKTLAPIIVTFHSSPKAWQIIGTHSILHGGTPEDFLTYVLGYPLTYFTYKRELRDSRAAVAVSRVLVSELLDEMGTQYSEKLCAIENGVDLEELDREYHDGLESPDTILFAGRLNWQKGALNLIHLATCFLTEKPELKVIVHGRGPLLNKMKHLATTLGLKNLDLRGFTSKTELMESMAKSTFIVLPSFYEGFPMILVEGMCLGKIPVMFDLPYARELTENGANGILAKDTQDMAAKIISMSRQRDLQDFKATIKRTSRAKFDMKLKAMQYRDLYKYVCNSV